MKHKMTYRLTGYFSAVLLLFSVIAGVLFWALFTWHTADIHEKELRSRAVSIADTLSRLSPRKNKGPGMSGGYGAYLRFMDDIAMSEVWLADENAQTIQMCQKNTSLSYQELPSGAEDLIKQVFEGKVVTNREFSPVLDVPCITAGAPVYDTKGTVTEAVLLHSPVAGISNAQHDGVVILVFCILTGLLLAFFLSVVLVRHFINPLKCMGMAAEKVMRGDYSARTGVVQDDEIGYLACNMDELFGQLANVEEERKRLDKMRQDFVSNISHELRTPVTVIRGSLEVLEQGMITDPGEMQEYFQQMRKDTAQLQRLINDLLELSRLQNANFHIDKAEWNLTDIIKEAIRSMQQIAQQKHVRIQLEHEIGTICFRGDYGRLRQMFVIVLDNAVKFSPPDGMVTVKICREEKRYQVSVSDCGKGILPEDIPYVFNRFFKECSENNKSGSGLGLSIAKQIADRHNIAIECESNGMDNTTFSFIFDSDACRMDDTLNLCD
ncbi:sensor histidine kinase [Lachnospiraceae bacterium]|nr:sensor histidine kinase [Lachnospiraceae bacterium]